MLNDKFARALNRTIQLAGTQVKITYYGMSIGSVWDDDITYAAGSTVWTSGVIFSLNARQGSSDSVLLQQGKLIDSDKKLYTNGSLIMNGSLNSVIIQIGSPIGDLYSTIEDGGNIKEVNGVPIYKKQFIRRLTGSIL